MRRERIETLQDLVRLVERTTAASKEAAARRVPALCAPALLPRISLATKEIVYPITVESASGSRIRDVDGNEYIDVLMGFGVGMFGHNPPFLAAALRAALDRGVQIGAHDRDSAEVANLMVEITGFDRVVFCNSGTEAVMSAIRLARAATGRRTIVQFSGSYHGHADTTLVRAGGAGGEAVPRFLGVPDSVAADVIVLDYGSPSALEVIAREGDRLAAVIVEPVQRANVRLQPREFLQELRASTARTGTKLIFDEVLTGFRLHPRGAQGWFGVDGDLAAYGKVLGGGMPIGAVAGRREVMNFVDGGPWRFGDDSGPCSFTTFVAGTFSKHPLAMAAAAAVLRRMKEDGAEMCRRVNDATARFVSSVNQRAEALGVRATAAGSLAALDFIEGPPLTTGPASAGDILYYLLLLRGVYASGAGATYAFSAAHDDHDFDRVADAITDSLPTALRLAARP